MVWVKVVRGFGRWVWKRIVDGGFRWVFTGNRLKECFGMIWNVSMIF